MFFYLSVLEINKIEGGLIVIGIGTQSGESINSSKTLEH